MGELTAGFGTRLDRCVIDYAGVTTHTRKPALHRRRRLKCYMRLVGGVNENGEVYIIDDVVFDVGL